MLAKRLIQQYWQAFTGDEYTWNFYLSPKHYMPTDRWASREQWICAAKECVARKNQNTFMKTAPYSRLDGAIARMRMADRKWPPQ